MLGSWIGCGEGGLSYQSGFDRWDSCRRTAVRESTGDRRIGQEWVFVASARVFELDHNLLSMYN